MKTQLIHTALIFGLSASVALADGLPIIGAYGSKWACATYKTAGVDGIYSTSEQRVDGDGLILPDKVVEPGRLCLFKMDAGGKIENGDMGAECTQHMNSGETLHYTNTVIFKKVSANVIFYGEAHASLNYHRCK